MENLFILTAVAGATEFLRRLRVRDIFGAVTILVSALIGGLAGVLQLASVPNFETGLIVGLSASGLVTVASRFAGSTLPNRPTESV